MGYWDLRVFTSDVTGCVTAFFFIGLVAAGIYILLWPLVFLTFPLIWISISFLAALILGFLTGAVELGSIAAAPLSIWAAIVLFMTGRGILDPDFDLMWPWGYVNVAPWLITSLALTAVLALANFFFGGRDYNGYEDDDDGYVWRG